MSVTWNGEAVMAEIRGAAAKSVGAAAEHVAARVRRKISSPYPPASRPFAPPHLRSGTLRASVITLMDVTDRENPTAYVQATAPHADYLQQGTPRMAPRPFLDTTLFEEADAVRRILSSWSAASLFARAASLFSSLFS